MAVPTSALLYAHGWWNLLVLLPVAVARSAYPGAEHTAMAYGQGVRVAFDLHRFDLLRQLRLPQPHTLEEERLLSDRVCLMWRQSMDLTYRYQHHDQ